MTSQPYQPPVVPKPKMSRGKKAVLWIVGVFVGLAVIGAIGDATGAGKKQNAASTAGAASASSTAARAAASSVKPSAVPSAAVKRATSRPAASTVPADGGSYPNAAAILSKLSAAGLACTAPSPMAGNAAVLFDPGATSLTICDSPGGTAQDTQVTVFDTAAHLAAYEKTADANASSQAVGFLAGANWAIESTPAYATRAHAKLGGELTIVPGAAAASAPAASTGTSTLLKSAGPLGAYVANGSDVYCDQATAYYEPDGDGGVRVQVYFDSSGILNIDATSKNGDADASQSYTQGTQGPAGHEFDLTGLAPGNVNEIDFGVTSPLGGGDCQVQPLAK